MKKFSLTCVVVLSSLLLNNVYAGPDTISLFPLDKYDQTVSNWIKPTDDNYDTPLLSKPIQQKRLEIFYEHYFGSVSPWNIDFVTRILQQAAPDDLKTLEKSLLSYFSNENKPDNEIGYGENFRPHSVAWIDAISANLNLSQFDHLTYQFENRGIAVDNLQARALPTDDVHFYNYKLAGQGYPFDNLQISTLWAGTPVYILGETKDHAWELVITPEYIGWVKSQGIARADSAFVSNWSSAAKTNLVAITQTNTSIANEKGRFLFSSYVGSVFPGVTTADGFQLMVPAADEDQNAVVKKAWVSTDVATSMPLTATPHHFATIMQTLISRPYGWGGMYLYNDCSQELKSLFTPFGIWLPRHSSDQVNVGTKVDMTTASADKRLAYLMENGRSFLTLVYISNHVVLYVGNYSNPNKTGAMMAMTYQNVWGLSPNPPDRRAIIGKSVLLPMLLEYPEDASLVSEAGKKYFQVAFLNEMPTIHFTIEQKIIDIRSMMYPETFLN